MNATQIWQTVLERIRKQVSRAVFTVWFQGTTAQTFQDGIFVVRVPTTFAKAHLENRFIERVRPLLVEVAGQPLEVQFVVAKENGDEPGQSEPDQGETSTDAIPPRRQYRMARGRPSAAQRERRIADTAAAAMNSLAPISSNASVHRSIPNEHEEQAETPFSFAPEPETPRVEEDEPRMAPPTTATQDSKLSFASLFAVPAEGLLNPRYTFKSFIVGKSNQLAHVAALAVSETPGRVYNPLFFYGGVGLGKTHLLHAIGHVGETAGLNVLYVTSEKFTNEIINAIRFQKTEEFRAKYRQIDILLVDDIQFIAGKESTEEEFFHTFNTLHNASKQIVVTSDRPPKAIHSLQDRLRSRFEWGLLADIQPPEYEHRLAILRSKADSVRFHIPSSVIDYIARQECTSVRELEGALNRVIAYATLHDAPLTQQLAAQALEHLYNESKPVAVNLTTREVMEGVCRYYNVDPALMRGKQRDREIVWPRQVAMYLMREETTASLLQIGAELGGRDHTTIMHGWEKVHAEVTHNERIRREIAAVLESLQRGRA